MYILKVSQVPAFKIQDLKEAAASDYLVFAFVFSSTLSFVDC
jgi:hypothetical protein